MSVRWHQVIYLLVTRYYTVVGRNDAVDNVAVVAVYVHYTLEHTCGGKYRYMQHTCIHATSQLHGTHAAHMHAAHMHMQHTCMRAHHTCMQHTYMTACMHDCMLVHLHACMHHATYMHAIMQHTCNIVPGGRMPQAAMSRSTACVAAWSSMRESKPM